MRVVLGMLEVEVAIGDCGTVDIGVPISSVDLETVPAAAGPAWHLQTPGVDVEIPDQPARHAEATQVDFELPGVCAPNIVARGRAPVVDVTIPDNGDQIPRRVQVGVAQISVPDGATAAPVRLIVPAMEQNVPGCDGAFRRVSTPVIEMGLVASTDENQQVPTVVHVVVPAQSADSSQRQTVPATPPNTSF
jgi:hypothetical protein